MTKGRRIVTGALMMIPFTAMSSYEAYLHFETVVLVLYPVGIFFSFLIFFIGACIATPPYSHE